MEEKEKNLPVSAESNPDNLPAVQDLGTEEEDDLNRRSEMPFLDHLEELRQRILWCLGVLFISIIIGFILNSRYDLLQVLVQPVEPYLKNGKLMIIRPTEGFIIALKLSFLFGLLLSSPVIIYHFWGFVAPALLKKERKLLFPVLIFSIFMFLLGAIMAFYVTLPLGMAFFSKFQFASTEFMLTASSYLDMATQMVLYTGAVFELPLVIMVLARLGLVSPEFMRKKRRHAILAIFIMAMIITPPDPGSMVLVAVPMVFLYEISIWIATVMARKRAESA